MRKRGIVVYLDHAATSWPKHPDVLRAMDRYAEYAGGNPGRSAHSLAVRAAETLYECRSAVADFFGVSSPEHVILTMNTTYALNMAIKGFAHPGDHILISDLEHNAVWRPVETLVRVKGISYDLFPGMLRSDEVTETLGRLIRPETRMIISTAASNICSLKPPVREIGVFCRSHNILFVVDAAQLAGHEPILLNECLADAVAVPGHKGLGGPQGIGLLLLREGVIPEPLIDGGTGVLSLENHMPDFLPERLEAGTLPGPAAAGLLAAVRQFGTETLAERTEKEKMLSALLAERLRNDARIHVFGKSDGAVYSFTLHGVTPQDVGKHLGEHGICVRTGFHCAPLAHRTLGTGESGTVRVSIGHTNTKDDIRRFGDVLTKIERDNPM